MRASITINIEGLPDDTSLAPDGTLAAALLAGAQAAVPPIKAAYPDHTVDGSFDLHVDVS